MSAGIENYTGGLIAHQEGNDEAEYAYVAIPTESEAVLKSRFYLDVLLAVDDVQSGGTAHGFIGGCEVGSENYKMHADARQFYLGGVEGSDDYVFFNDAGLNTFGKALRDVTLYKWANNLGFTITFRSSYFADSSELGVKYRKKGTSEWFKAVDSTHLASKGVVTKDVHIDSAYEESDVIEIKPYIINTEGESNMSISEITLDENVWSYGGVKRAVSCSTVNQEGIIIWVKESQWANIGNVTQTDANTGIFLYTDVKMNTLVSGNFWIYGLDGNKSFRVQSGEIRMYDICTTTPPVVTLFYEMSIGNLYRFKAKVSRSYSQDITVTARIDISPEVTANAKYLSITIPQGQTEVQEPITRDLSDNTYHFYNEAVTPASLPLVVTPL